MIRASPHSLLLRGVRASRGGGKPRGRVEPGAGRMVPRREGAAIPLLGGVPSGGSSNPAAGVMNAFPRDGFLSTRAAAVLFTPPGARSALETPPRRQRIDHQRKRNPHGVCPRLQSRPVARTLQPHRDLLVGDESQVKGTHFLAQWKPSERLTRLVE
jgi:hypothetical protein